MYFSKIPSLYYVKGNRKVKLNKVIFSVRKPFGISCFYLYWDEIKSSEETHEPIG